jgi:hypothetical protein
VTTSFLPDRERARQEEELKKQLKRVGAPAPARNATTLAAFGGKARQSRAVVHPEFAHLQEWQAQQDRVKSEPLMIVYSYWDGSGHRREIKVKKGDTVRQEQP